MGSCLSCGKRIPFLQLQCAACKDEAQRLPSPDKIKGKKRLINEDDE